MERQHPSSTSLQEQAREPEQASDSEPAQGPGPAHGSGPAHHSDPHAHEPPFEHAKDMATGHDTPMEDVEPAAPFWLVGGSYLIVLTIVAVIGFLIWTFVAA